MNISIAPAFTIAAFLFLAAPSFSAAQLTEEQAVMAFSEDSLTTLEDGVLVSSSNCSNAQKEAADDALELSLSEVAKSKETHAMFGLPVPTDTTDNERLLVNKEFLMNYDDDLLTSTWVSFRLRKEDVVSRPRINCFRTDPRLDDSNSATLFDYVENVYDRGHLAARADMNRSKNAMLNTFVLSNMAPQHDNFNQGVWERFESFVRKWSADRETIYVVTGAIFDKDEDGKRDTDGNVDRIKPDRVGVATGFYKIVLHQKPNGFIESIAILLPHNDDLPKNSPFSKMRQHLKDHITTIDAIEKISGYDFFSDLPDNKEAAVESSKADDLW